MWATNPSGCNWVNEKVFKSSFILVPNSSYHWPKYDIKKFLMLNINKYEWEVVKTFLLQIYSNKIWNFIVN